MIKRPFLPFALFFTFYLLFIIKEQKPQKRIIGLVDYSQTASNAERQRYISEITRSISPNLQQGDQLRLMQLIEPQLQKRKLYLILI